MPEMFRFEIIERDEIKKLVNSVKSEIDLAGAQHYEYDKNIATKISNSAPVGWFFEDKIPTKVDAATQTENHQSQTFLFLNKLSETASKNVTRKKEGYRYDSDIREWATFLRMIAGPMAYETVQRNLEGALPALSSTNRYIRKTDECVVEGVLRTQQLFNYLTDRNLPLVVSLSEDATRINSKVQYDARANQIVGFVLPLDGETGMPIPYSYPARNIEEICTHFRAQHEISSNANVVMAQPIAENVPPFGLLIFGSDGKYTAQQVERRWIFIANSLEQLGIEVLTVASDSEPRYNSAMRRISLLGSKSRLFPQAKWFSMSDEAILRCLQDTLHILTKMRNRLLTTLKNPEMLPFGPNNFIQVQHVQYLLDNCRKDEHLLTQSAITPTDKQNIQSIKSIIEPRVTDLLSEKLPLSRATVFYLQMMRNINDSYLDKQLSPLSRINKIWSCVFVLRIWRKYIRAEKNYTMKKNCITTNCYSCIELNAHTMVHLIMHLRDNNMPDLFKLDLMDSQPCESFFRQIRSLTTTNSTVVNFSLKEMLERLNRINLQYEISQNPNFVFPRMKKPATDPIQQEMPSNDDIFKSIEEAKKGAIDIARTFGLIGESVQIDRLIACDLKPTKKRNKIDDDVWEDLPIDPVSYDFSRVLLHNYADKFGDNEVDDTSPYVEIYRTPECRMIVKTTSICWLLRKETNKLSSDRLLRVRGPQFNKSKRNETQENNKAKEPSTLPLRRKFPTVRSTLYKK